MRQHPARAEQTETPVQIVTRLLRGAAVAPTNQEALDVPCDALRCLAAIARGEVPRA